MQRPANLIYGRDDIPPLFLRIGLGFQHVAVLSVGWIFVVLVVDGFGGNREQATNLIRCSMIASGIGSIIQALNRGPVGCGYFCPVSMGPVYIPASIMAGKLGGLHLLFGMTVFAGAVELFLSRFVHRLRSLFPVEVTGLIVATVGIELISLGCPRFISIPAGGDGGSFFVSCATLGLMVGLTVWGRGKWKLFPVLAGLVAGYLLSFFLGGFSGADKELFLAEHWLGLPHYHDLGFQFDASLIIPFLIASTACMVKTVGDITLSQKINDTGWRHSDMHNVGKGIAASGLTTMLSGLGGGVGQSTFSSNLGLALATGVTSRVIAFATGGILILLAFVPRVGMVFAIMPPPVMGAILVYVASFMIVAGLQLITTRMLDARRTFIIGLPLIFGLSVEIVPGLYRGVPEIFSPIFATALSFTTILVLLLNAILRLGISKTLSFSFSNRDLPPYIRNQVNKFGERCGARAEVVRRVVFALENVQELIKEFKLTEQPVSVKISFDELNINVEARYQGLPFPEHSPVGADELVRNPLPLTMAHFTAYLIFKSCDELSVESGDEGQVLNLRWDH